MILLRANTFWEPLQGVGLEMEASEASAIWTQKKSRFSGPIPFIGPSNGSARIKIQ
jgi:hypothetical protein